MSAWFQSGCAMFTAAVNNTDTSKISIENHAAIRLKRACYFFGSELVPAIGLLTLKMTGGQ
jgi:hypothetical protein